VLAALFLIVALATLAMPGSSNFVGEFLILLGVFKSKLVIAVIAFSGVVGAAVYALRLFITAMHNRLGPRVSSHEITRGELIALAPLVLIILVLAFDPQFVLRRTEPTVKATVAGAIPGSSAVASRFPRGWTAYAPLKTASTSP
jgi:NADH-quinone oxidoreductase subunit M